MARTRSSKKEKDVKVGKPSNDTRRKAYASAAIGAESKKRLFLIGILAVFLIVIAVICIINKNKEGNGSEPQIGQYFVKQMQCSQDADCPDNTFCDGMGLCVTMDLLPLPTSRNVLGRGRAAEGKTIKASVRSQGQKDSN